MSATNGGRHTYPDSGDHGGGEFGGGDLSGAHRGGPGPGPGDPGPGARNADGRELPPDLESAFEKLLSAAGLHLAELNDPVEVELFISEISAAWSDRSGRPRIGRPAVPSIAELFIGYAERCGTAAALAMLRGLAVLGNDRERALAVAAADRLGAAGIAEPVWAGELNRVRVTGCWTYCETFQDQTGVMVGFEQGGQRHSLIVLVEHNMGEIATDAFIGGDPDQVRENFRLEAPRVAFHEVDPAQGRAQIERAFAMTDIASEAPVTKNFHATRALARARLRAMPPASPPTPRPTAAQRARIIADFILSPQGARLADQDAAIRCVERVIDHSLAFDEGRILRVSPMKTQIFLLAWVPLKTVLTDRERDAMPAVVAAWARWVGRRREFPEWAQQQLDAAVADLGAKFPAVYANPPLTPGMHAMRTRLADHIDGGLPDLEELQGVLERRTFALPNAGARIGDTHYPQLDPTVMHERWLLILGEHPEYHELLADMDGPSGAVSIDGVMPQAHLDTHDVVVTQLWNDDPPEAWQAAQRLTAAGIERHEALHALCEVVSFHLLTGVKPDELAHNEAYRRDLDALGRSAHSQPSSDPDQQ